MSNPIPDNLRDEFKARMDDNNHDCLPDGAWLAVLTDSAEQFMDEHKLRGDAHDAALQYIGMCSDAALQYNGICSKE